MALSLCWFRRSGLGFPSRLELCGLFLLNATSGAITALVVNRQLTLRPHADAALLPPHAEAARFEAERVRREIGRCSSMTFPGC